ncbi:MAG: DUF481 domain-containing protein [Gammaproteobacteria bacterium]|nr:DUF481 domain-containing protein [Gammaproteobacteria bacterium]
MRIYPLSCCLLLLSNAVMADWSGDMELGYLALDGNSDSQTLNAKFDVTNDVEPLRHNIHLEAANSSQDGQRTAEKYLLSSQLDYVINDASYAFLFGSYEDDQFSGFDFQSTVASGYGYRLIKTGAMLLALEGGPGYRINEREEGSREEDIIVRLAQEYSWDFAETASLEQSLNAERGEDNTITRFQVAVKSQLVGNLALKVGYGIKYTESVPADRKHADTETAVTLVYRF